MTNLTTQAHKMIERLEMPQRVQQVGSTELALELSNRIASEAAALIRNLLAEREAKADAVKHEW